MREFLLLIRNQRDHQAAWPPEKHQQFLESCEAYIGQLTAEHKLISAQPLVREGAMVSGSKDAWSTGPISDTNEVIVGYYHILADDIEDAVATAKRNPEFEYSVTARVEVRPIKMSEDTTGFVYPTTSSQS